MRRLALLLWLAAGTAAAHSDGAGGTTGFASVQVGGQSIRYTLTLAADALAPAGLDPATADLARLVADHVHVVADGQPCAALPQPLTPPAADRANLFVVVLYACAGPVRALALRDDIFDRLGADHHTLVLVEWPDGRQQASLDPVQRSVTVSIPQPERSMSRHAWLGAAAALIAGAAAVLIWRRYAST